MRPPIQNPASEPSHTDLPADARAHFRPRERIRDAADFRRAFARKRAVSNDMLVVHAVENGLCHVRLGISVPRKLTRKSSVRNRLKRLVREAFRLNKPEFAQGVDFVVVPRSTKLTFAQVHDSLPHLARDAARRLAQPSRATRVEPS